jgi:hypothetical protein
MWTSVFNNSPEIRIGPGYELPSGKNLSLKGTLLVSAQKWIISADATHAHWMGRDGCSKI